LPMKIEKQMAWCLKKGEGGSKHKGLRVTEPSAGKAREHIKKAEHNAEFAKAVFGLGRFHDWVFPASFYAAYHACLAALAYFGYESRNQECTFTAMEHLIREEKLNLPLDDIGRIRSAGAETEAQDIKGLREEFQYGLQTEVEEKMASRALDSASAFVLRVKGILYAMMGEV